MAQDADLVLLLGAELAPTSPAPHYRRPYFRAATCCANERIVAHSGVVEFLDDADSWPHRYAQHRDSHARRAKDSRRRFDPNPADRWPVGTCAERRAGYAQRIC